MSFDLAQLVPILAPGDDNPNRPRLTAWAQEEAAFARLVRAYREYAEGQQPLNMTPEMKSMFRPDTFEDLVGFSDNHCELVLQTMTDRLTVSRLEADTTEAQAWVDGVLEFNRFDGMQNDVHEACLRDGDTYLLLWWDNDAKAVRFSHQLAFDGVNGMVVLYDRVGGPVSAAIRIWQDGADSRVVIYRAGKVERYISRAGAVLEAFSEPTANLGTVDDWVFPLTKAPIGVPVVAFRNRRKSYGNHGRSELASAVSLQNSINRTLASLVIASELSAMQIRTAIGFDPPDKLAPGSWVVVNPSGGISKDQRVEIGAMAQGELAPFLDTLRYLSSELGKVTRTPLPELMGGETQSGEALKQRENGLLGKVNRFQTKVGNDWEDTIATARRIQQAFGAEQPPAELTVSTKWEDAEIRNDTVVIDNAVKVKDDVGAREFLRLCAKVFDWTEDDIARIMTEKTEDDGNRLQSVLAGMPTFGSGENNLTDTTTAAAA